MSTPVYGVPVFPRIAIGIVKKYNPEIPRPATHLIEQDWADTEYRAWQIAVSAAQEQLANLIGAQASGDIPDILRSHLAMLEDPELEREVRDNIYERRQNVQLALTEAVNSHLRRFHKISNAYMRARAADLQDIHARLMRILRGAPEDVLGELDEPVVVVARGLGPSETVGLNRSMVLGLAADQGNSTAHTAIIAQQLGMPAVVGCLRLYDAVVDGDTVILDGEEGVVIIQPDPEQIEQYAKKQQMMEARRQKRESLKQSPALTSDGRRVELAANVMCMSDLHDVAGSNIGGIGMLNSEMFYMECPAWPDEEEQFEFYRQVAETMEGRPAAIRTIEMDVRRMPAGAVRDEEVSPAQGYRPLHYCLDHAEVFKTQLRAILRASAFGQLRIMFPMIISVEEMVACRRLLETCKNELDARWQAYDREIEIGLMAETPAVVILAAELAPLVDFFYISADVLAQHILAADRRNARVAPLCRCCHPAVLRGMAYIVQQAHQAGRWVGLTTALPDGCDVVPVLLGMGVDELSACPAALPECKEVISRHTWESCLDLAGQVLAMGSCAEVEARLAVTAE